MDEHDGRYIAYEPFGKFFYAYESWLEKNVQSSSHIVTSIGGRQVEFLLEENLRNGRVFVPIDKSVPHILVIWSGNPA